MKQALLSQKIILLFLVIVSSVVIGDDLAVVVATSMSNLYVEPKKSTSDLSLPLRRQDNPNQISQLLFGEPVLIQQQFTDELGQNWIYVSALKQDVVNDKFEKRPCTGWMSADDISVFTPMKQQNIVISSLFALLFDKNGSEIITLPIGSLLVGKKISDNIWQVIMPDSNFAYIKDSDVYYYTDQVEESIDQLRRKVIENARQFLGSFYCWGGRTSQSSIWNPSGVDCSGMINLSFLAQGLHVPRNSKSQYLVSKYLEHGCQLEAGDIVCLGIKSSNGLMMNHVMLYTGNDMLLEASGSDGKVQEISFVEKFGKHHSDLRSDDFITHITTGKEYQIFFGTYFSSELSIQKLRLNMF